LNVKLTRNSVCFRLSVLDTTWVGFYIDPKPAFLPAYQQFRLSRKIAASGGLRIIRMANSLNSPEVGISRSIFKNPSFLFKKTPKNLKNDICRVLRFLHFQVKSFKFFLTYWNCYYFYNVHLSSDSACVKNLKWKPDKPLRTLKNLKPAKFFLFKYLGFHQIWAKDGMFSYVGFLQSLGSDNF